MNKTANIDSSMKLLKIRLINAYMNGVKNTMAKYKKGKPINTNNTHNKKIKNSFMQIQFYIVIILGL